jgi:hypothetical protein
MFVPPIKRGLLVPPAPRPKRQTIRAHGKRRHARPGEELQLYTGMRTKHCRLIGRARCTRVRNITIAFRKTWRRDWVKINGGRGPDGDIIDRPTLLDAFAQRDGFEDWRELRRFWAKHHKDVRDFEGLLIEWEPL